MKHNAIFAWSRLAVLGLLLLPAGVPAASASAPVETAITLKSSRRFWLTTFSVLLVIAGLVQELQAGTINLKGKRVVVVCTGHGMKDPDIIVKHMQTPLVLPAHFDEIEEAILGDA